MFQYCDGTFSIRFMPMYFPNWSYVAVVPARLAELIPAAGLYCIDAPPAMKSHSACPGQPPVKTGFLEVFAFFPQAARRALSVSRPLVTVTRNPKPSRGWRRPGIWRPSVHPAAVFFKFITNLRDQILANPVHFMIYCEKTAKNGRIGLFSVFVIFVIFCHF